MCSKLQNRKSAYNGVPKKNNNNKLKEHLRVYFNEMTFYNLETLLNTQSKLKHHKVPLDSYVGYKNRILLKACELQL